MLNTSVWAAVDTLSPPANKAFDHDSLYNLLVAEFAIQRNDASSALSLYSTEALRVRDPNVVERALQVANFLQNSDVALPLAQLNSQLHSDQANAFYQLAYHSLKQQQYEQAMQAVDRLLVLEPEAELEALFLSAYPPTASARKDLLEALTSLEKSHSDNAHLLFAHALLAGETGDTSNALSYVQRSRQKNPDSIPALLLEVRLLGLNKQDSLALDLLEKAVVQKPKSRQLGLNYAKLLIKAKRYMAAETELSQLLQYLPNDSELLLMHGLLAYDNKHDNMANNSLNKLVLLGDHADEAHYYLALVARRANQLHVAEQHLEAIEGGSQYLSAQTELAQLRANDNRLPEAQRQLQAARQSQPDLAATLYVIEAELLHQNQKTDEGYRVLQEAISKYPNDNTVLFSRAMFADKLKNFPQFEQDMQQLILRDPNNATYLNALGYTLADETRRYGEAEYYLRQAYQLKPDDPAIIDSMGWLFYRQGDMKQGLAYVRRAYDLSGDEEIGVHLAELLWVSGQKADARKMWQQLLSKHPNSDMVLKHKAQWEQKP